VQTPLPRAIQMVRVEQPAKTIAQKERNKGAMKISVSVPERARKTINQMKIRLMNWKETVLTKMMVLFRLNRPNQ
jgi:hypothetical protein